MTSGAWRAFRDTVKFTTWTKPFLMIKWIWYKCCQPFVSQEQSPFWIYIHTRYLEVRVSCQIKIRPENIFWRSMFNHSYIVKILLISHLNKPNYMIWSCQISKPNSCTLTWNKLSMYYPFSHCSLFLKLRITLSLVVNSVLNSIVSNWVNWKRRNRNSKM